MTEDRSIVPNEIESPGKLGLAQATALLRRHVLSKDEGAFLGTEDELLTLLGASRGTLRQIARILEREGLLVVRRGINGGYYGMRPSLDSIETAVSGYLHTLDVKSSDATMIASTLWVQTLRKLAGWSDPGKLQLLDRFLERLAKMDVDASLQDIVCYEMDFRDAVFDYMDSRYVQLIFKINVKFSAGNLADSLELAPDQHAAFARAWRNTKYLELAAVANGDRAMTVEAVTRARRIWHERFASDEDLI